MEPDSFKDFGGHSDDFKNLPKITDEDAQAAMKKQGVWGDQSTYVDPEDFDIARTDDFVEMSKREAEELDLKQLDEYKAFRETNQVIERSSPTFALANQKHGPATGFYHDDGRHDPVYWLKLQHMIFRDPNVPFIHPTQKYGCTERLLWDCVKKLDPVYMNRAPKGEIIFDAGDVRSTIDDNLLEKSSTAAQKADGLRQVSAATCKMRCFTTSCRVASTKRKSASSFSMMLWLAGPWNSERGFELMTGTSTLRRTHLDF